MEKAGKKEYYDHIVRYFLDSEIAYQQGWDLKHSLSLHGGYWDEKATTFRQSLQRLNAVLAEIAAIQPTDHVLDAGCGVGGSSIYLAKNIRCSVVGITLVDLHVLKAQQNAKNDHVEEKVKFLNRDYLETGFEDNSFDVVWAIESVCYAREKNDFIKEAYRLLKPGGRLILADYFQSRKPKDEKESNEYRIFLDAFHCVSLDTEFEFSQKLKETGFSQIINLDKSVNFWPNLRRAYLLGISAFYLNTFLGYFGIKRKNEVKTKSAMAAILMDKFFKNHLIQYQVFCAVK